MTAIKTRMEQHPLTLSAGTVLAAAITAFVLTMFFASQWWLVTGVSFVVGLVVVAVWVIDWPRIGTQHSAISGILLMMAVLVDIFCPRLFGFDQVFDWVSLLTGLICGGAASVPTLILLNELT